MTKKTRKQFTGTRVRGPMSMALRPRETCTRDEATEWLQQRTRSVLRRRQEIS